MKLEIPNLQSGGVGGNGGSRSFDGNERPLRSMATLGVGASSSKDDSAMMIPVIGDLKAEYTKLEEEKDRLYKEWESMQQSSDNIFATHTTPIMVVPSSSSEPVSSASTPPMMNHHHDESDDDLKMVESRDEMLIKDLNNMLGPTASSHEREAVSAERDDISSSTPVIVDAMFGKRSPTSPISPPPITRANHVRSETSSSSWSDGTNSIISAPSREDFHQQQQHLQRQQEKLREASLASAAEAVTTARSIIATQQHGTAVVNHRSPSSSSEESMIEQLRSMNQKLEQEKVQIMADWEAISTSSQYQKQILKNLPAPPSFDQHGRSATNDSDGSDATEDFIDAIEFPKPSHTSEDDENFKECHVPADSTVHSRLTEDGAFLASLPIDDDIISAAEAYDGVLTSTKPIEHLHHDAKIHKLEDIASLSASAGTSSREVWLENALVEWRQRAESAINELQANRIIAKDREGKNEAQRVRMLEAENKELRAIHEDMRGTMKQWSDKQRTSVDGLMEQLQEGGHRESILLKQLADAKAQADGAKFRLDEYKKRNKTMDDVLLAHQNDIVTARKQVAILEDENKELRDVNRVQTEMMEMLTQLRDALQNQIHEQGKTVDSIRAHMNSHETREVELRTELEKAKMEIQNLHIQMNAAKMSKTQMMEQYANLERSSDATNLRIKDLERENEDLRVITVQVEDAMMAQADEEDQKLEAMKNQLDDTANREALLRKTLGKAKDASELLRKEMHSVETRNQQIAKTLSTTREELRSEIRQSDMLTRELEQLRAVNRELDADKVRCENEIKRLQVELAKAQTEVEETTKQSKEAEEFHEKACKSLEEDLADTKKQLSERQDEVLKATMAIANLQSEIGTAQHSLKAMEERTKRAEEEAARFCSPLFALASESTK